MAVRVRVRGERVCGPLPLPSADLDRHSRQQSCGVELSRASSQLLPAVPVRARALVRPYADPRPLLRRPSAPIRLCPLLPSLHAHCNAALIAPGSFNKYIQVAARATRQALKEEQRVAAERRAAVTLKVQRWENGKPGNAVRAF